MSEISPTKAARIAAAEKEKKARKKYTITVAAVCACVVVLVLFVLIFSSNLFYNVTAAVDAGGYKFTVADFNFNYMSVYESYYNNMYSTYGSYGDLVSSLLPDTSKSLADQAYPGGEDGMTWADYFEQAALERMQNIAMLCSEAKAAGVTASQEQLDSVEETIASAKAQAETNGFPSFSSYLARIYGKGMTEKVYRRNLEREALATTYSTKVQDDLTYTQEQKDSYYDEHKDEYDVLTYRSCFFSGSAVADDESTEEDETVSAEDAMAKAEADSAALKEKATSEQAFIDAVAALHTDEDGYDADAATLTQAMGSNLGSSIKDWLLSADRKAGDVDVIRTPDDASTQGFYVLYFINRDDNRYHAVSGYYGLVAPATDNVSADAYDNDEDYDQAVRELTEINATGVLKEYENGSDKTLEGFQQVMTDNSDMLSESGTLDRIGIYDVPDEVSQWLHDPARTAGDTTTVYVPGTGSFILFFSVDDGVYYELIADSNLRSADYSEWAEGAIEKYPIHTQWEMKLTKQLPSLGE